MRRTAIASGHPCFDREESEAALPWGVKAVSINLQSTLQLRNEPEMAGRA